MSPAVALTLGETPAQGHTSPYAHIIILKPFGNVVPTCCKLQCCSSTQEGAAAAGNPAVSKKLAGPACCKVFPLSKACRMMGAGAPTCCPAKTLISVLMLHSLAGHTWVVSTLC